MFTRRKKPPGSRPRTTRLGNLDTELKDLYGDEPIDPREGQKYGVNRLAGVKRHDPNRWKMHKYTGDFFESPFFHAIWPFLKVLGYLIGGFLGLAVVLFILRLNMAFGILGFVILAFAAHTIYWISKNPHLS